MALRCIANRDKCQHGQQQFAYCALPDNISALYISRQIQYYLPFAVRTGLFQVAGCSLSVATYAALRSPIPPSAVRDRLHPHSWLSIRSILAVMEVEVPSPQGMPLFLAKHPDLLAAYLTCVERKEVKVEHLPPGLVSDAHVIHSNVRPIRCKLPLSPPKTLASPSTSRRCTPVSSNHEQQVAAAGSKSNNALSSSPPFRDKAKSIASSATKKKSSIATKPSARSTIPTSTARKNNGSVSSLANSKSVGPSIDQAAAVAHTKPKKATTTFTSPAKARTSGKQSTNIPLPVSSSRSGVTKKHDSSTSKRAARQVLKHLSDGKDIGIKKTSAADEVTEVEVQNVAEPTLNSMENRFAALSSSQKTTSPIGIVPRRAQRSTTYSVEKEHELHSRACRTNTTTQLPKSETAIGEKSLSKTLPSRATSTNRFNSGGIPEVVEVRKQRKGDDVELIVLDSEKPCSTQVQKATRIREMLESNVGGSSTRSNAKATSSSTDKTAAKGNPLVPPRTGSFHSGVSRSSHSITKNRSARSRMSKVRTEHLMIARTRAGAAETSQSIDLSQSTPPRPNYGLSQDRNDSNAHGVERIRQSSRLSQDRNHNSVDLTNPTRQSSRLSQGRSEDSRRRSNSSKAGGRSQMSSQNKTVGSNKSKHQSGGQKQVSPSPKQVLPSFARSSGSQAQRPVRGHNSQILTGNARRKNNNNNTRNKNTSPKQAKTGARKGKVQTTLNLSTNNKTGRSDVIVIDETPPRTPSVQRGVSKSGRANISRCRERPNNGSKDSTSGNGQNGNRGKSLKKNLAVVDLCSD